MSLLTRMLALVLSFTCIALVIKNGTRRVTELRSTTGMSSSEAQVELSDRGPSFVTVVLPRYVLPRARPLLSSEHLQLFTRTLKRSQA